jgi:hypothetical protein
VNKKNERSHAQVMQKHAPAPPGEGQERTSTDQPHLVNTTMWPASCFNVSWRAPRNRASHAGCECDSSACLHRSIRESSAEAADAAAGEVGGEALTVQRR